MADTQQRQATTGVAPPAKPPTGPSATRWLALIASGFVLVGLALIVIYGLATSGKPWQTVSVGLLTAMAALAGGLLFGFLFGVPRYISSGQFRYETMTKVKTPPKVDPGPTVDGQAAPEAAGAATLPPAPSPPADSPPADIPAVASPPDGSAALKFTPSTNLAEVSDWLTKLLLGAGLVQLTHLGAPLAALINNVAAGLTGGHAVADNGAAQVMAGAILVTYSVLGFLIGYVLTTLWYGRRLSHLGLDQ